MKKLLIIILLLFPFILSAEEEKIKEIFGYKFGASLEDIEKKNIVSLNKDKTGYLVKPNFEDENKESKDLLDLEYPLFHDFNRIEILFTPKSRKLYHIMVSNLEHQTFDLFPCRVTTQLMKRYLIKKYNFLKEYQKEGPNVIILNSKNNDVHITCNEISKAPGGSGFISLSVFDVDLTYKKLKIPKF